MEKLLDKVAAHFAAALGTLPRTVPTERLKARKEARKATQKASKALAKAKRAKASRREKGKVKVRKEKENLVESILVKKLNTTTVQVLLRPPHGCWVPGSAYQILRRHLLRLSLRHLQKPWMAVMFAPREWVNMLRFLPR